ncbi:phosphoethanolamine transferase [Azospira restricta]|uniref:Sulfatase-like hydrolase/transferase n=1 Tax=Azospira restricta TaxID=404405 RepID=A0A974PYN4_9RHOO|nr:sulfatase-like hydrolase/transferase [Azospira restricta]QRJ63513.1 sulfatase-like hydrolase/transferase [Azospira restricta]
MNALRRLAAACSRRFQWRVETLALALSLWFTVACNPLFWAAALHERALTEAHTLAYAAALGGVLTALHFVLLALFATLVPRRAIRPLFAALAAGTAAAAYYMRAYHVYLDPEMIRNVLHTDVREAGELFSWGMLPPLLGYLLPPLALLACCELRALPRARAAGFRLASIAAGTAVAALATVAAFQDLSALVREKKEVRYLITPANYLYSAARNLVADTKADTVARLPVGADAAPAASWQQRAKPALLVVVVGETARAANWGLSGYARQTTPELAALDVINFAKVTACGTSTEVSVPCMLSPYGRHAYDERRIRGSEALPHVLRHGGFRVAWLDNQSGCKGTCDGLENWRPDRASSPADCPDGGCRDGALLAGARQLTAGPAGNTVLFLHPIGNHGPTYAKRYPPEFRRFTPTCETADLGRCTQQEIVNSYDNALLYTDHVLAAAVAFLKEKQATHDTALLFVSDHGESLGEKGLYLHGMPYAIAPQVQKEVPMVLWLSAGYRDSFALDADCLRRRAAAPATHDHLFHTVLGLLDLQTAARDADYDLAAGCRRPPTTIAATPPGGAPGPAGKG